MSICQRVAAWYAAATKQSSANLPLQQPAKSLAPASAHRAADWLARHDTASTSRKSNEPAAKLDDFIVEDDIQLPLSAAAHLGRPDERGLESVEKLHEAFKRLDEQLDAISDSQQTYNQPPEP